MTAHNSKSTLKQFWLARGCQNNNGLFPTNNQYSLSYHKSMSLVRQLNYKAHHLIKYKTHKHKHNSVCSLNQQDQMCFEPARQSRFPQWTIDQLTSTKALFSDAYYFTSASASTILYNTSTFELEVGNSASRARTSTIISNLNHFQESISNKLRASNPKQMLEWMQWVQNITSKNEQDERWLPELRMSLFWVLC